MATIYMIDDGKLDGVPGLVKEIVRDKIESFDLIKYKDKFDQETEFVWDYHAMNGTVIYKRVVKIARITENKE